MATKEKNDALSFEKSAAIRKLIDTAGSENVDTEILREILWLTSADTRLLGFLTAVQRLLKILELVPDTWSEAIQESGISSWQPVLSWISENGNRLKKPLGPEFACRYNTTGHNPLQGSTLSVFPMYAVLCEPLPKGQSGDSFILLTAHLLLGYVNAVRASSKLADYETHGNELDWSFALNKVDPAARAVRRYALTTNRALLTELQVTYLPEDFAEYLQDAARPKDQDFLNDHQALVRFLEKCHDLREWRDGSGGGGSGSGGGQWIGDRFEAPKLTVEKIYQDPDAGAEADWGSIELVKFQTGSSQRRKERIKSGLHPDEDQDEEEVLLSDFDCAITKQDPGALARTSRAKARHVSKHNQVFSWTYDTLADAEIGELLTLLDQELNALMACAKWTAPQLQQVEVWLFLQATLWTGCDAARAANISIRQSDKNFANDKVPQWIVVPPDGPIDRIHWRIEAFTPTYATSKEGNPDQLRSHEPFIDLADLVGFAPLIARIIESGGSDNRNRKLFRSDPDRIKKDARSWLTKNFSGARITLQKIESTLWSKLHRHTGDAALASCTISDKHRLASVRLHYTSPWVRTLQKHYGEVVASMLVLSNPTCVRPSPAMAWSSCKVTGAVGARMCPTTGAVRSMFARLSQDIDDASDYRDRTGFTRYHNRLTLFTVQMFAYATTCRAIRTPYLPMSSVCLARNLTTLSDKDDEFHHKTRLIWIPPVLEKQMTFYDQHLFKLKSEPLKGESKILLEPCFFLGTGYKLQRVRPKSLTPLLNIYLQGAVANTHRRFLRTELLERGCNPEVVDAFLGHWQNGEEPFGLYSSFNFLEYIAELRTHLAPLLKDIGLVRPIQSRLAY